MLLLSTSLLKFQVSFLCLYCVLYGTATNGKGVHMLKVGSKRRRTAAQIADLKVEELRKKERAEELERRN